MKSALSILLTLAFLVSIVSTIFIHDAKADTTLDDLEILDSLKDEIGLDGLDIFDSLKAESTVELDFSESLVENPLSLNEEHIIPINISYKISGIFSDLFSKILSKSTSTIDLSVETNEYCTVSISPESVEANITSEATKVDSNIKLSVKINDDATALSDLKITVKAKAAEVKGPLGLASWVKESDNATLEIAVKPDYLAEIEVNPDFDFKEIPPFNITKIPVNITNNGNGKTKVVMELLNATEHFNITIPGYLVIDVNETKQFIIEVEPDNDFDQETLKINFAPSYYEDSSLTGSSIIESIELKNDGSYKEEDNGLEIDLGIVAILIFAIVLLLVFIFIIIGRL